MNIENEKSPKVKVIAFYLPQFHPIAENDEWWGAGFTEWRNVTKARPLFRGHHQPVLPGELGFYDLRVPEVREQQAKLARDHNIFGFAYWHYWFGNKKMLLERPLQEVIKSGKPDFPFCLAWANHSWSNKTWTTTKIFKSEVTLMKQEYLGEEDNRIHFYTMLDAFKDKRYIRINDRLLFIIYKPFDIPEVKKFTLQWNELAEKEGLKGFHFLGLSYGVDHKIEPSDFGLQGIINSTNLVYAKENLHKRSRVRTLIKYAFKRPPYVFSYKDVLPYLNEDNNLIYKKDWYPSIMPNWDNSPRSGLQGIILKDPNPELFRKHVKDAFNKVSRFNHKIVFLKSWNEWGEGNYIEPDLIYGRRYLEVLSEEINKI